MADCEKDYCDVSKIVYGSGAEEVPDKNGPMQGIIGEQKRKLIRWGIEPMDYDAPGSTVRESGV